MQLPKFPQGFPWGPEAKSPSPVWQVQLLLKVAVGE